jgi:hypothetical protein
MLLITSAIKLMYKKRYPELRAPFYRIISNFFNECSYNAYSGEIASTGQTSAQDPQSVHNSGSIT